MTCVGSGSLIIVALLMIYPMLARRDLVGTDLVQAVPLVASASLGHILFGDFQLGLTTVAARRRIPGVFIGAQHLRRGPRAASSAGRCRSSCSPARSSCSTSPTPSWP